MNIDTSDFNKLKKLVTDVTTFLNLLEGQNAIKLEFPTAKRYAFTQLFGENPAIYKPLGFKGHFGVDIGAPYGTEILACDDGIVSRSGHTSGNGNYIEIRHTWGYSIYLHLKFPSTFNTNDQVRRKDRIGLVGNSGYVIPKPSVSNPLAGTHLHFSIKIDGIKNTEYKDWVDPMPFFIASK